ncbi:hypothetical protein BTVI_112204 [Pitangus sulphuratus]|nr:hypothetical protein BTVI_112204 [Pitangus sulphuratus]
MKKLLFVVRQYILECVETKTLEQMMKYQGMITEKEDTELREISQISVKEDKAREDFAVSSVSRINWTTLLAVKSKGNPMRRKTETGDPKGSMQKVRAHSGRDNNCYSCKEEAEVSLEQFSRKVK